MGNLFSSGKRPIAPPKVESDQMIPLHYFDDTQINKSLVIYFMLQFDDVLDPEKLRSCLERLLNRNGWRKLGARLRLNDRGKLDYHIPKSYDREKKPSFMYSHVDYDMSISDHELASRLPKPTLNPATFEDSEAFLPLMGPTNHPRRIEDYLYYDRAQLGLHIVSFSDATLVSLFWPHTFLDAMGRKALLDAWTLVMEGREDEVLPLIGFDLDPLAELGLHPTEPYKFAPQQLSTWQFILFGLRYWFETLWWPQEEGRTICVPAGFIKRLRNQALKELHEQHSSSQKSDANPPFLSEGDVLCAWWSKLAITQIPRDSGRTISIMNAYGLRSVLSKDLLPKSGVYIANAVFAIFTYVKARDLFRLPISTVAGMIRSSIVEMGTREQMEAMAAVHRTSTKKSGFPALYGDATMHLLNFSNWTKARFFETDFSVAVVKGTAQDMPVRSKTSTGRPSFINCFSFANGFSVRNTFAIVGKDTEGNFWVTGKLRKHAWPEVERLVAVADVQ